jgi:hypothetical protein
LHVRSRRLLERGDHGCVRGRRHPAVAALSPGNSRERVARLASAQWLPAAYACGVSRIRVTWHVLAGAKTRCPTQGDDVELSLDLIVITTNAGSNAIALSATFHVKILKQIVAVGAHLSLRDRPLPQHRYREHPQRRRLSGICRDFKMRDACVCLRIYPLQRIKIGVLG